MEYTVNQIKNSFKIVRELILQTSAEEAEFKARPEKWSKKQILGHLCDSAINNLQRFTEVQYESKPYKIMGYKQDELVLANDYQHAPIEQILNLWLALNTQIIALIINQTNETLQYEIIIGAELKTLRWLMEDYATHLHHHVKQLTNKC